LNNNSVIVAMSGGVDSSVALLRVVEEGYRAVGVTMKLWDHGGDTSASYCCSTEAVENAKKVCESVGVEHHLFDYQDAFQQDVVDYLVGEYFEGRTPNPCIRCNTRVRWSALLLKADELNAHWIATGHYAIIEHVDDGKPILKKGHDSRKDQSYVLWGLSSDALARTIFPLGRLTKGEVRRIAKEANLVTAEVAESQELCFVPDDNYRQFLHDYASEQTNAESGGNFVDGEGNVMGQHKGISAYTIGQRRGLGIPGPEALYVTDIDANKNRVTVAPRSGAYFSGCIVRDLNWYGEPDTSILHILIRYNHSGVACSLDWNSDGTVNVEFETPQFAVTPGQSAVFYAGDTLVGGGIIVNGFAAE